MTIKCRRNEQQVKQKTCLTNNLKFDKICDWNLFNLPKCDSLSNLLFKYGLWFESSFFLYFLFPLFQSFMYSLRPGGLERTQRQMRLRLCVPDDMWSRGRKRKNDLLCFSHQKVTGLIPVATGVFRYHHCQLFNKTLCFGEGDTKGERERERERESEIKLRERERHLGTWNQYQFWPACGELAKLIEIKTWRQLTALLRPSEDRQIETLNPNTTK